MGDGGTLTAACTIGTDPLEGHGDLIQQRSQLFLADHHPASIFSAIVHGAFAGLVDAIKAEIFLSVQLQP